MKYCPECGHSLDSGSEKFCPECGEGLVQAATSGRYDNKKSSIGITNTKGDVFGAGVSGTGHIIGKEIGYTVQGNVIHLNISGNMSREVIDNLQKIIAVPTHIDQAVHATRGVASTTKEEAIENKIEESSNAQQQIKSILEEVNKIEEKEGTKIEEIRAENIQISRNELSLKEYILKGNEYLYKKEYYDAMSWYDKAIEIDPNNAIARFNKRSAVAQYQRRFMLDFKKKMGLR